MDIIWKRRSIRFFKHDPLPRDVMLSILRAGLQAPSPKNRESWKLIVVEGKAKEEMLSKMAEGIARKEEEKGDLPGMRSLLGSAKFTMRIMKAAPVTVFVTNPLGKDIYEPWDASEKIHEMSDIQAIGALAENMALEAASQGIGSLWIGNVFFAYDELVSWLNAGQMVLAMSFGYPAHHPSPLPRKKEEETIEWRS